MAHQHSAQSPRKIASGGMAEVFGRERGLEGFKKIAPSARAPHLSEKKQFTHVRDSARERASVALERSSVEIASATNTSSS